MLNVYLDRIMTVLGLQGRELAEYSGFNPSIISNMRTGKRVPDASSTTIVKLTDGIVMWANDNEKMDVLMNLLKKEGIDVDNNSPQMSIILLLYRDRPENISIHKTAIKEARLLHFSEKLCAVTDMLNLSNVKLGKALNVDPSYISRFKNGQRIPKTDSKLLENLCKSIYGRALTKDKKRELAELINYPTDGELNDIAMYPFFRQWLCDLNNSYLSIMQLLSTIDSFSPEITDKLFPYEEVRKSLLEKEILAEYPGTKGLQQASELFLMTAIEKGCREVLLYSDENMDWMILDKHFRLRWMSLMMELIKRGIRIRIIHNIDRSVQEMIEGIRSWMPLYLSGLVEPYYLNNSPGDRFSHTMFIVPGECAITAFNINSKENIGVYHFTKEPELVKIYENEYNYLLENGNPLVKAYYGKENKYHAAAPIDNERLKNISISLNNNSVIINKLNNPKMTFVFLHPLMCDAFRAFLNQ
ncbi:hypothetical protein SAMN06297422_10254 [Lachnospiraceae bacterium]|nr:hypothetical protein SAMN06297422_10254 [Lachnospiraceae bacterium]